MELLYEGAPHDAPVKHQVTNITRLPPLIGEHSPAVLTIITNSHWFYTPII